MSTSLEQQILALDLPTPEDLISGVLERAAAPAPAPAPPRWKGRKLVYGLAIGSLFVGANIAAAEYVPPYRDFVRSLAFMEADDAVRIKRAAGIPEEDVVPHGTTVEVREFLLTVVGTYADGYRTTVLLTVDRNPDVPATAEYLPDFNRTTIHLKDSTGRIYRYNGGTGEVGHDSTAALDFDPLVAGAADQGPITLVVSNLDIDLGDGYQGSWELEVSFEQQEAPSLPVPPSPLVSGNSEYNITSIVASGYYLIIEWQATGGAVERLAKFHEENPEWWSEGATDQFLRMSLWPQMFDSGGAWVAGGRASNEDIIDGVYYGFQEIRLPEPGEYTIRFGRFTEGGADYSASDPGWRVKIGE
jgi:hypothetical protein